jgi:hypothetical protein
MQMPESMFAKGQCQKVCLPMPMQGTQMPMPENMFSNGIHMFFQYGNTNANARQDICAAPAAFNANEQ